MGGTLYTLLGVAPTATAEEIRAAYLSQVARYHPDRHEGNPLSGLATERLAALNQAWEVLGDPERRAQYDAALRAARARPWWSRPWAVLLLALAFLLLLRAPFLRGVLRPGGPGLLVLAILVGLGLAAWAWLHWRARQPLRRVVHPAGKHRPK